MSSSSAIKNELLEMDLYKLFEIEETSTLDQIKKAYRKKALQLHPDKHLDNKEEAEKKFVELGKAFEILADKSAKAAYDAVRRQKREKAKRDELLDDKKRKLKQDLENREKAAKEKFEKQTSEFKKNKEEEVLKNEIDRLRKEGSKLLQEEMDFINEQIKMEKKIPTKPIRSERVKSSSNENKVSPRIKITWSAKSNEGGINLDEGLLNYLFSKYGEIEILVVSKKSSAIIEFKNYDDAIKCLNDERNLQCNYSISLKCVSGLANATEQKLAEENPAEKITNTLDSDVIVDKINSAASFEEMEMAILKKLKSNNK